MKPIHVNHAPKLIKWKNKRAILEFTNRFYSPSVFIVSFLSAFDFIGNQYTIFILATISIFFSIYISYHAWIRWKRDFIYLAERETKIPWKTACVVFAAECILQLLASILSLWWISKVPECIPYERRTQAYMWLTVLFITFLCHIIFHKKISKEMDECLRNTYEHVNVEV